MQVGKVAVVLDMSIVIWVCPNSTGWHQLQKWRVADALWQTLCGISLGRFLRLGTTDWVMIFPCQLEVSEQKGVAQKRSRVDFMDNPSMDDWCGSPKETPPMRRSANHPFIGSQPDRPFSQIRSIFSRRYNLSISKCTERVGHCHIFYGHCLHFDHPKNNQAKSPWLPIW